jgi:hypothetical protein
MSETMLSQFAETPEAELVREIEELIRKVAAGRASSGDLQLLQELQKRRVELMRPRRHFAG